MFYTVVVANKVYCTGATYVEAVRLQVECRALGIYCTIEQTDARD